MLYDVASFSNQIGLGTLFVLGGLAAAYWAIRNSISGTQRNELEIANARADRLVRENTEMRANIVALEAKTDLQSVIKLLEAAEMKTHEKLDVMTRELDKVRKEVVGLRSDMAKRP